MNHKFKVKLHRHLLNYVNIHFLDKSIYNYIPRIQNNYRNSPHLLPLPSIKLHRNVYVVHYHYIFISRFQLSLSSVKTFCYELSRT
uniref:Uncharacterized protein n=1 Tax=Cannabis sativa TaxID=3483 RepID=A0A803R9L6_CANSA